MPCMKLMSASAGVLGGVRTLASESVLLRCPGAPGCTTGAFPAAGFGCWANAAAALRESNRTDRTLSAMRQYTSGCFTRSIRSRRTVLHPAGIFATHAVSWRGLSARRAGTMPERLGSWQSLVAASPRCGAGNPARSSFQPAGAAGKRVRSLKRLPHTTDLEEHLYGQLDNSRI